MIILAIGGAVIKTAWRELKQVIRGGEVGMLIHNGGSLFHDFQRSTEVMTSHSYPLKDILKNHEVLRPASEMVWKWIEKGEAPSNSLTHLCQSRGVKVLMFTALGTDFWQMFEGEWTKIALECKSGFRELCNIMKSQPFHYICMGSAVIHPEVFIKAVAITHPKKFRADVVDFKDMYRPRTRVACYGKYYMMEHRAFLKKWLEGGLDKI